MADELHLDPDADPFKPPPGSILVHCIHCGEEYESFRIEWRIEDCPDGKHGFWCCPIEGCDGKGFGFDIFPIDPEEAARYGIEISDDDGEEEEWLEDDLDDLDGLDDTLPPPGAGDDEISDEDIPF